MSVRLEAVTAGYVKGVPILRGIDLVVAPQSITTVIGPNGSGKSTLLRAIVGQVPFLDGVIRVDGQDLQHAAVHHRVIEHHLAFVPQVANVFGPLSIIENLEIGGARLPKRERRARITEMLDSYPDLATKRRARAESLSGGQRQLLAVARALMTRPTTLLLDEPSAGLSPRMMDEMFDTVRTIRDEHQVTILLVEQNAAQSLQISDHGVVLVAGEVAVSGPAEDILANRRVGELYLGSA